MGSAAWPSTHQHKFGYCHCWVPNLPATETYTESPVWHCSLGWSASYLWQVDYIGLLSPLVAQLVNNLAAVGETQVWSLGQEDPLEKGMAAHSSILAWRILRTEEPEPGGLQSMWSQRVRQDLTINTLSWKGQRFILAETDTYSVYRFAFPAQNASAKTTIHRLRECLIYFLLLFYKALLLIKELISQQKKKKKKKSVAMA